MKTHTRVAVIGGGIAGCSALYHLCQEGITDCVLIERDELTSGTTWHSAAQVTNYGFNMTSFGLKTHSINLYKRLSEDPDYPINYHYGTGGMRLATTQQHVEGYKHHISMAKGMGVELEYIDAEECGRRHPLITTDGLIGAAWDPRDGDIDPAQLCQALAFHARRMGAEIYRFNPVMSLRQRPDHSWEVQTKNGLIVAEIIVNAAGYRANEVAAMYGQEHAIAAMEHQYMVTAPLPALEAIDERVPLIRCPTHDFYARQEKKGLLIGFYEQDCRAWGLGGIDPHFTNALCPDDMDRVADLMDGIISRLPVLADAGIAAVVNGPITYTPDGPPLVGPLPGLRNAYACCGMRIGLGEGGGHGWLLSQMIAHGETPYDTWMMDPRRFPEAANVEWTALKAIEDYQNEFRFHLPHEHRPAGRQLRTSPIYGQLKALGAEFTVVDGWERADYFKPSSDFHEAHDFKFTDVFPIVAEEVAAVARNVGIAELAGFSRFALSGEGVHAFLDKLTCSTVPKRVGKVGLVYLLNDGGNIAFEATVANLPDGTVWLIAAANSERALADWLDLHNDAGIAIENLTRSHTTIIVSGPKARALMAEAAPRDEWSANAFPWLNARSVQVGFAPVMALSVSFNGEVSFELHVRNESAVAAYDHLWEKGRTMGLRPFGARAAESMRIEKGFRHWKSDLITEFDPIESGLNRFVRLDKDYVGRAALEARRASGPRRTFVTLRIDADHAPALGGDSILAGGRCVGSVTSGDWGHRVGANLAMGFIDPEIAAAAPALEVELVGEPAPATIIATGPYDPTFEHLRTR